MLLRKIRQLLCLKPLRNLLGLLLQKMLLRLLLRNLLPYCLRPVLHCRRRLPEKGSWLLLPKM